MIRWTSSFGVALAVLSGWLAGGCRGDEGPDEPGHGVLVIAIDALRYDHLGHLGYDRDTTPTLDELAAEGVSFRNAYSCAPQMIPTHVSLLSGCDPNIARRPSPPDSPPETLLSTWFIPERAPRVAREFLAAGYATAAFVDHPWISPLYGFDQGFQTFRSFVAANVHSAADMGVEGVALPFFRWLGRRDRDEDWFAYLTVNDLERVWRRTNPRADTFFEPREELGQLPPVAHTGRVFFAIPRYRWTGGSYTLGEYEAKYDGTLRFLDQKLNRLFNQMRYMDWWDTTTIVVVGTYGVSFGESGMILDTGTLTEVDLHVPLIVKPDMRVAYERGARPEGVLSLIDLAPTLLKLGGLPEPPGMQGRSQAPVLRGRKEEVRDVAFASCAVQGGWAAMNERYCFEHILPGSRGPGPLTSSWFGKDQPASHGAYEFLDDRYIEDSPGVMQRPVDLPEMADSLRASGADWYHWIELARRVLHPVAWYEEPISAEQLEELRDRELIP